MYLNSTLRDLVGLDAVRDFSAVIEKYNTMNNSCIIFFLIH